MKTKILRIGHRKARDARVSTHCGLVARALGAQEITYSGQKDPELLESISKVTKKWGGSFKARYEKNWKKEIQKHKGQKIHLTMYGLPIQKQIQKIRANKQDKLIIIGSEKVPPEVYQLATHNIAVTNQPHSEIAALAVFLHELYQGKELTKKYKKPKTRITPSARNKKVKTLK